MQVELRHQPSFWVARLHLAAGEPARVEAGAMVATSYGVQVEAKVHGGLMKGLRRGFVFDFSGPGRLLVQSRNPTALVGWLTAVLPFSRS